MCMGLVVMGKATMVSLDHCSQKILQLYHKHRLLKIKYKASTRREREKKKKKIDKYKGVFSNTLETLTVLGVEGWVLTKHDHAARRPLLVPLGKTVVQLS